MSLESIMYFALGALASALVMLMVMPAIWRRAVRLTKKRIEAATPVSLAEFRADKDQLRAEFALSTRRLEMQVEQLRKRLAEQLGGVDQRRRDLAALKTERADHETQVGELETREAELRDRIAALEKEGAGLNERLAAADRTLAQKATQLADAREALRTKLPPTQYDNGRGLSGNYDEDIDELVTALAVEKKRASFLEAQTRDLMAHLEAVDRKSIDADAALAELKRNLLPKDDKKAAANQNLAEAEVRIAHAGNALDALLAESARQAVASEPAAEQPLAEMLSADAQLDALRRQVGAVEATIMADWGSDRADPAALREQMGAIALDVSRLVYAVETRATPDEEESLFDRVQRFAGDSGKAEPVSSSAPAEQAAIPQPAAATRRPGGSVLDRMAALRALQGRN